MINAQLLRKLRLLPAVAALLGLAACAVEQPAPALVDPTGFVTYVHPSGVFTLSMPPDWVVSDTSDDYALNVAFSPPGSPEPVVSVYVVSSAALAAGAGNGEPAGSLEALSEAYRRGFYTFSDALYKEMGRETQADGSLRVRFLIEAPEGTSQHNDFLQVVGGYFVALRTRLPDDPAQVRTLSRIINTLSVNTLAEWASAVEPAGEDAAARNVVGFTGLNHWVDRNGGFVIVGQVTNQGGAPLEFVRINALLYDADSRVLLERDNFVSSDVIQPGEAAPFSIIFNDGLPPGTVRYDLAASARYADATTGTFYGASNFALTSGADFDENGLLVVSGQVRNEGPQAAELVKVIATIFDEQGHVVATDTTLVDQPALAPGETTTFAVRFFELGGSPDSFQVTAQGLIGQ